VHLAGHRPLDEVRRVAVAAQQPDQLVLGDPGQHRRIGDLVPVQVQDRQHRAVASGVEELVGVPARRERSGLGLTVTHDRRDDQVGVVEGGAVGVGEGVAQLTTLVDRARGLRGHVAGDPAGKGELPEQAPHAVGVLPDTGIDLAVGALEPGRRHEAGAAVTGADDVHHVRVAGHDRAIEVRVDEVEPGRRSPVAQQSGLDVLREKPLAQQRVGHQVDLAHGEVVRRAPPGVDAGKLGPAERVSLDGAPRGFGSTHRSPSGWAPDAIGTAARWVSHHALRSHARLGRAESPRPCPRRPATPGGPRSGPPGPLVTPRPVPSLWQQRPRPAQS
jgi:hypothetical protein